jgi:putative selenate reductase
MRQLRQLLPLARPPVQGQGHDLQLPQDFDNSSNAGFLVEGSACACARPARSMSCPSTRPAAVEGAPPELTDLCRIISQVHARHGYLLSAVEE